MPEISHSQTEMYLRLIDEHSPLIYKVCYMYSDDSEHLKDLYQEVLANLWQGLDGYMSRSKPSTWIYRVAINTCITYFRRHGKHSDVARIDDAMLGIVDENQEHAEQLRQMYEMIAQLGKLDRAIIMLWLDEHSYDEISDVTGLSRNNVASRLYRIKQRLMKLNDE